jgi:hypothetical protein
MVMGAVLALVSAGTAAGQQMTADDWRSDLQYLARVIDEVHPNPYLFHDRDEFVAAVDQLSESLDGMTDDQAIAGLSRITAMIRDGHSSLQWTSARFPSPGSLPLRLRATPDGWVVVGVAGESESILGGIVKTIAGRPASEVMDDLAKYMGADNESQELLRAPMLLAMGRYALGSGLVDESGSLPITVDVGGTTVDTEIALDPSATGLAWMRDPFAAPGNDGHSVADRWKTRPLAFARTGMPYWSEYLPEHEALYLQINQINDSSRPSLINGDESVLQLNEFLSASLALTESREIGKLIIDLRFNGGGDNFLARDMVRTLHQYPELNDDGRLLVLTGAQTFSAAMNLVSILEIYTGALFVGEPPGNRPNHYGDARGFTLPSSGLGVRISTLNWQLGTNAWDVRILMQPDIWAPFDQAALVEGRDPALEAALVHEDGTLLADRLMDEFEGSGVEGALELFESEVRPSEPGMWHFHSDPLFTLGYALFRRGVPVPEVAGIFVRASHLYPDRPDVLFSIGRVAGRVPNWEMAAQMYEGAAALWPQNGVIATHLARARLELEAGD